MSQLGVVVLQETVRRRRGRESRRTILEVLTDQMGSGDAATVAGRRSFKQRLRLTGIGCCGAAWGFGRMAATISVGDVDNDNDEEEGNERRRHNISTPPQRPPQTTTTNLSQLLILEVDQGCSGPVNNSISGMNLAAALAAERNFREAEEAVPSTPARVSLMSLLEETEASGGGGGDAAEKKGSSRENNDHNNKEAGGLGCDSVCCVCMGRKKGAAFIPCGHTFCRVCSREVWLNRGSCPLCNRTILEILDIF